MRWIFPKLNQESVNQLKESFGFHSVLAELLSVRLPDDLGKVDSFISPKLSQLDDPFRITNLKNAVERIQTALNKNESILIYGDYDVDGVTSTSLLCQFFDHYKTKPSYFVPNRVDEGYGLSEDGLKRAIGNNKTDLFIAVDCGTSSSDLVEQLRKQKIDVIIIDHHTSKEALPADCILVNPKVWDDESEAWYDLCTAGLVFKVIHGLLKLLRQKEDTIAKQIDPKEFLDLVALGTIADLVPLKAENRIFAYHGLKEINKRGRSGLEALIQYAGLADQSNITSSDLGFRVGPRINAGGRISDATEAIDLFLSKDYQSAKKIAAKLEAFNRDRQTIEKKIVQQAEAQAEKIAASDVLVLFDESWHAGVVGIVASRISRLHHTPTIILGADENTDLIKGSGRSVEGIDFVEALKSCSHLLEKWGGHPMAVGLSLPKANLEKFRKALAHSVINLTKGIQPEQSLKISSILRINELSEAFLNSMECLEPYGQENPEPIFVIEGVRIFDLRTVGTQHLSFRIGESFQNSIRGIFWNGVKNPIPQKQKLNLAIRLGWNEYRGTRSPQVTLLDWKES